MYLSDDLENPTKYQIEEEANTVIAPYGYLIIWADKLMTITQLHAPFKLATEGGYITLTAEDYTWGDTLYYEPHLGVESVGLYPDGSNDVYTMTTPTIAKPNTINSYAAWIEQPENPGNGEGVEYIEATNLIFTATAHTLYIYSPHATSATIALYTTTGQQCMHTATSLTSGRASISLASLASGIYIATVTDSEGNTEVLKIKVE